VARLIAHGRARPLLLEQLEDLLASEVFILDACRHAVRRRGTIIPLARRPLLFTLARMLSEAWPEDLPRNDLIVRAFRIRHVDETHRARLRVEIGRLRTALKPLANITATARGYRLAPHQTDKVAVLAQPAEGPHGTLLALLADGESWSSSALALALGTSQRTVQRALDSLASHGKVQSYGHGRTRRWTTPPMPG